MKKNIDAKMEAAEEKMSQAKSTRIQQYNIPSTVTATRTTPRKVKKKSGERSQTMSLFNISDENKESE